MDEHDLEVVQGTTFNRKFQLNQPDGTPVDLTGYVIRLTARKTHRGRLLVEATSENGMISVSPTSGEFWLAVPASVTATFPPGDGVYDLQIETGTGDDKWVGRLMFGTITVIADVQSEAA